MAWLALAPLLLPLCALADPRGIGEPPEPLTPEVIEAERLQRVEDIKAWLPRLVGRFTYEGVVDLNGDVYFSRQEKAKKKSALPSEDPPSESPETDVAPDTDEGDPIDPFKIKRAHGMGDCVAIGAGPGVHCVIDVVWEDEGKLAALEVRGEEAFLSPASTLYGIDANAGALRYLQLDKDGLTETELGVIRGNTLTWIVNTQSAAGKFSRRTTRVYARPGSKTVQTTIEFEELTRDEGWKLRATISFDGRRVAEGAEQDRLPEAGELDAT